MIGYKTNNESEYTSLIYGMRSALNLNIKNIHIFGDSKLIIQ